MTKIIRKGDILSETQFYTVADARNGRLTLKTDSGDTVTVDDNYAQTLLSSANHFDATTKVTRTELTDIFLNHSRVAMTVNFNKQVKPEDVVDNIAGLYPKLSMGMTEDDFKKKVKQQLSLKGEERTMVGRHYGGQDVNGRVNFVDMELEKDSSKDYETRLRLVDPRTLNYVIVAGVKYVVK